MFLPNLLCVIHKSRHVIRTGVRLKYVITQSHPNFVSKSPLKNPKSCSILHHVSFVYCLRIFTIYVTSPGRMLFFKTLRCHDMRTCIPVLISSKRMDKLSLNLDIVFRFANPMDDDEVFLYSLNDEFHRSQNLVRILMSPWAMWIGRISSNNLF